MHIDSAKLSPGCGFPVPQESTLVLIEAGERIDFMIASVTRYAATKRPPDVSGTPSASITVCKPIKEAWRKISRHGSTWWDQTL